MNKYPVVPGFDTSLLDRSFAADPHSVTTCSGFFPENNSSCPNITAVENLMHWGNSQNPHGAFLKTRFDEGSDVVNLADSQNEQRARSEQAIQEAITAERNRLARELHDAVTQTLFSASLIAEVLPELWDMDEAEARNSTQELRQLTRGALAEMRTLLLELRPVALTQARLTDLLKQLGEAVTGRARLPIHVQLCGECELPTDVKLAFYRVAQESLNNIVKYARASRVEINVCLDNAQVSMEITDNGIGFDATTVKPTSLGLRIMHERADAIHAQFRITSTPGQGTRVCLEWTPADSPKNLSENY
jgi:signal transduction histidine kinase